MGMFGWLKADKPEKKIGAAAGQNSSTIMAQGFNEVPHNDTFKAYIPNFLYKPPFGYPLNKDTTKLKELAKNPYIFSVIRTLKDEASTSKWEIKVKKEFAGEDVFAGNYDEQIKQASAWFYNPNGNEESFNDIIAQWIVDLCEIDAAVGVKVFDKGKRFSQLFSRDGSTFLKNCDIYGYMGNRAEFVDPVSDMSFYTVTPSMPVYKDKIQSYSTEYAATAAYFQYGWTGVGLPVPFGRREIVYIMSNPRSDSIYGRSPIEILYDTILTLIYGQNYNLDFYLNGNAPDGLIHLAGADQEIATAFQERMLNKFTAKDTLGYQRRLGHRYPVYGGPEANFVPFQISAKDMEIIEQQKWFTKMVWAAFGVTPDEMGFTEDSNKAVSQTQTAVHKRKALKPMLKKIEYVINTQIMPEIDPSGKLEFCFEDYDLDEEMKKYTLYEKQIQIGVKTAEMIANEEGLNITELKKQKEEERQKSMEEAQKTNPGFLPDKQPEVKAELIAEQLAKGIKIEMEHTDNPDEAKKIALDHLKEHPFYYDYLERMEKEMKQDIAGRLGVGDTVKIVSGSKEHIGKLGQITKILNNGKEDYYEVKVTDGIDLCFIENIKKVNNPNFIPMVTEDLDKAQIIDDKQPEVKADISPQQTIIDRYKEIKKQLLEKVERENGTF